MANMSRFKEDVDKVLEKQLVGIFCFPKDNIFSALIVVLSSFHEHNNGCIYTLEVIPDKYPHSPPLIRLLSRNRIPKVCDEDGLVKLDLLKATNWTLAEVLRSLQDLFLVFTSQIATNTMKGSLLDDGYKAVYYAIRSGRIDFLNTVVSIFSGNNVEAAFMDSNDVISRAYADLKLMNVLLSQEMEIFVQNRLLTFRLAYQQTRNSSDTLSNIKDRVQIVLDNIALLKAEYFDAKKVDDKFIFIATFIAQNMHTLKRQLKFTYDRLPWEEVEFCLVSFVACHIKQQEINVFYRAFLNKRKVLNMLENFAFKLRNDLKDIDSVNRRRSLLPKTMRQMVVEQITRTFPEFSNLYSDYQQIRDIHSLTIISEYVELALSADPKQREGQLVMTRVLQVIGEYLKNTLESPKLSDSTSDLLLLTLPKNTRKIIIDLRNSLSHSNSLGKRKEFEENNDVNFFVGVQTDTCRISRVVTEILYRKKLNVVKLLLNKIVSCENNDEVLEIAETLANNNHVLKELVKERTEKPVGTSDVPITDHDKLKMLVKELSDIMPNKSSEVKEIFAKINNILKYELTKSEATKKHYKCGFATLMAVRIGFDSYEISHNRIRGFKFAAMKVIQFLSSPIEATNLRDIVELSREISSIATSVGSLENENLDTVVKLTCEISCVAEFGMGDLKWIEELKKRLNVRRESFVTGHATQEKSYSFTGGISNDQLPARLAELNSILDKNGFDEKFSQKVPFYLGNKKLQAILEMLLLDILSIVGTNQDHYLLRGVTPILIGKNLRNHLAHGNVLVDILLSNPSIAIVLNAKYHATEPQTGKKKKLSKPMMPKLQNYNDRYDSNLITLFNQKKMFDALERGNLEELKSYLDKGADIAARRSIDCWTSLHFAASGPNLEVVEFVLNQGLVVDVIDTIGRAPIHIAAAQGRANIVSYFIKSTGVFVDVKDTLGNTPLHYASKNGHNDTIRTLLLNSSYLNTRDSAGFSPLHLAITNNHIEAAMILIGKVANIDSHVIRGGYTPLHLAAENGCLVLVQYLLANKANVNAISDKGTTPLHLASLNGHSEVGNALIFKGANVNSRLLDGCQPLHNAVEIGDNELVASLLNQGAIVNAFVTPHKNTPLHYAAKAGNEKIVGFLLNKNANANVANVMGMTPLHLAAKSGRAKVVVSLLEHGANIMAKDNNSATPLHHAAEHGQKDVVDILIKNAASINSRNRYNQTALHLAAANDDKNIIKLLLESKAEVDVRDIKGCTPLHLAAGNSANADCIDILIANKAEVNAKTKQGAIPLHAAVLKGLEKAVDFLVTSGADVNCVDMLGVAPLHLAINGGHKGIVNILVENKADIKVSTTIGTPLDAAAILGHKDIASILIVNGAQISDSTLLCAIKENDKDFVKLLMENGALANCKSGEALSVAVWAGYIAIVEILLKNSVDVNWTKPDGSSLLHLAAIRGHNEILKTLLSFGAMVNAVKHTGDTPLHLAAQEGHENAVAILISNNANVNSVSNEASTPLHAAAVYGHSSVVTLLLAKGAKSNIRDELKRSPFELAVGYGRLQVVNIFLKHEQMDLNLKCDCENRTVLHIAAQQSNVEMVKLLVNEGADINAKHISGTKPIHVAAREGFKDIVEYLIEEQHQSVNEYGTVNQTLLHYAAIQGQLEMTTYLFSKGAEVNAKDTHGLTPLHIAAYFGHENIVKALLEHGAIFNATDIKQQTPLHMTTNAKVFYLLDAMEKLFKSMKNNPSPPYVETCVNVESFIRKGACVNAQDVTSGAPLHYAAWKGYDEVLKVLLNRKANPNALNKKGLAPIHYAAKFSHLNSVKILLSYGAIYNALSAGSKTPLDHVTSEDISLLFKLIDDSFKMVEESNDQVVSALKKIQDRSTLKSVMSARNRDNKTLLVSAMFRGFAKVEQLKWVGQCDLSLRMNEALQYLQQEEYVKSLNIFRKILDAKRELLGSGNPGSLDIQRHIATALYKQGDYLAALNECEDILPQQLKTLGPDSVDVLNTRKLIALVFYRMGKDGMALEIFEEICKKQKMVLGSDHSETLTSQFEMALVLNSLGRYDEAMNINKAFFEKMEKTSGPLCTASIAAQNNIAMVLANQKKYDEARDLYSKVLEKKRKILGKNHTDTLRTMHNIAALLEQQGKHCEALTAFEEVVDMQRKSIGGDHPETLNSQRSLANVLYGQGMFHSALKLFVEIYEPMKVIFGVNDSNVLDISVNIKNTSELLELGGSSPTEEVLNLLSNFKIANDDLQVHQDLLYTGDEVNKADAEGRTPLHFAVYSKNVNVVRIMLERGADVTRATIKGNTPLHTASSQGHKDIVELLLRHISRDKLHGFINAKTTSSGATALHVAAKSGFLDVVKSLLKYGATYDSTNKEGEKPVDLTKDLNIKNLLTLTTDAFKDVKRGHKAVIKKLRAVKADEFIAISNARNDVGNTLLQVAIAHGHNNIAKILSDMLKKE